MANNGTKNYIYALFLFMFIGLIIRVYLSLLPIDTMISKFVIDDTFVSLRISENIVNGLGVSFDGVILTNGFNVLQMLILIPMQYFFQDLIIPLRIFLILSSVFNVLTAVLIFKIVKKYTNNLAALFSAVLWLFNPIGIFISLNGIEGGLYCFFIALSVYYYLNIKDKITVKNSIILGL